MMALYARRPGLVRVALQGSKNEGLCHRIELGRTTQFEREPAVSDNELLNFI